MSYTLLGLPIYLQVPPGSSARVPPHPLSSAPNRTLTAWDLRETDTHGTRTPFETHGTETNPRGDFTSRNGDQRGKRHNKNDGFHPFMHPNEEHRRVKDQLIYFHSPNSQQIHHDWSGGTRDTFAPSSPTQRSPASSPPTGPPFQATRGPGREVRNFREAVPSRRAGRVGAKPGSGGRRTLAANQIQLAFHEFS